MKKVRLIKTTRGIYRVYLPKNATVQDIMIGNKRFLRIVTD